MSLYVLEGVSKFFQRRNQARVDAPDVPVAIGAGAITAVGNITRFGGVEVSYALWFIAFLPCALLTIFVAWRFALWAYPPEIKRTCASTLFSRTSWRMK